jgi:four helix bundle protein
MMFEGRSLKERTLDKIELMQRTKEFALRVMKMVNSLPSSMAGRTIGNQIIRSATSVGANYRAAQRGRSKAEFISKLGISLEEIDECCYWLELIMESGMLSEAKVKPLHTEANELTAILTAALKTAKKSARTT